MSDVELVKSRINIVDIIGEYVKLTKTGNSFKANCPFHQEKTPSFVVNEEKQIYRCFGCNQGGDVFTFLMEMEGITFREVLQMLAERVGVELQNNFQQASEEKQKDETYYTILDLATRFYSKQLWSSEDNLVLKYLRDRGLNDEIIKKFNLGFAPEGWHNLEKFLTSQNFTTEDIFQAGLLVKKDSGGFYDRFRNRIIYPIANSFGKTVGFTARVLPGQDEKQAKYINTPESSLYHKSDILYGIDLAKNFIKQKDQVIIMEGNMDVIASCQVEVNNVVAVSGTALTKNHINILKRYTNNFVLFFDSDQAGLEAMKRSAKICFSSDVNVLALTLKEGKDAADIVKENPEKLKEIVSQAKNVIYVLVDLLKSQHNLDDPREKRLAVEEIADFLSYISNSIEREEWTTKCAELFNVDEKNIFDFVNQKQTSQYKNNSQNFNHSQNKQVNKESSNESFKNSRLYQLYKLVALMMLAFPKVWQYVHEHKYKFQTLENHAFLKKLIDDGEKYNFKSENFINENPSSANLYKEVLVFKQNCESGESEEKLIVELEDYLKNIVLEKKKGEINNLTKQLKKAEKLGHYEEKKRLLEKLSQVSLNQF